MKIQKAFFLLVMITIIWACDSTNSDEMEPEEEKTEDENIKPIKLLMDSSCVKTGDIPTSLEQISLSYDQEQVHLISGLERFIKIDPDTSTISGFYLQVDGQDKYYCLESNSGFIPLAVEGSNDFDAKICAYGANEEVIGCIVLKVISHETIGEIFCDDEPGNKTWNWKYSLFNLNLFDYPGYNPKRTSKITGYCRTPDGTVESELTLIEEGWTNFVHLEMEDNSFVWTSNWYSKHWDILTTDCNKVGYDIDTVEQVFKGDYVYDADSEKLTLEFEKQHPEDGEHEVYLTCDLMIIRRKVKGTEGGSGGTFTMVFERLEEE